MEQNPKLLLSDLCSDESSTQPQSIKSDPIVDETSDDISLKNNLVSNLVDMKTISSDKKWETSDEVLTEEITSQISLIKSPEDEPVLEAIEIQSDVFEAIEIQSDVLETIEVQSDVLATIEVQSDKLDKLNKIPTEVSQQETDGNSTDAKESNMIDEHATLNSSNNETAELSNGQEREAQQVDVRLVADVDEMKIIQESESKQEKNEPSLPVDEQHLIEYKPDPPPDLEVDFQLSINFNASICSIESTEEKLAIKSDLQVINESTDMALIKPDPPEFNVTSEPMRQGDGINCPDIDDNHPIGDEKTELVTPTYIKDERLPADTESLSDIVKVEGAHEMSTKETCLTITDVNLENNIDSSVIGTKSGDTTDEEKSPINSDVNTTTTLGPQNTTKFEISLNSTTESSRIIDSTMLQTESSINPSLKEQNITATEADNAVTMKNDVNNIVIESSCDRKVASTDENISVSDIPLSNNKLDDAETCPDPLSIQSSITSMILDDDECSYEEIIVDDDDEFIEYVDEILDDDVFTEETYDSQNHFDCDYIVGDNNGFNGNVSRSSISDDQGPKRPVIKSATQKALEKEEAIKKAEAEEALKNVKFRIARQNSFCRKDDEYRKRLEMEEEEHRRQEEEEERKRLAEQERLSRLKAENAIAIISQQEEDDMRQQLYDKEVQRQAAEAEAHRVALAEAAREKEAAEKARREEEEKAKLERDAKRKAMEEEVRLLQVKLEEAKLAAEEAKKKQIEEKMRLKAKVEAHRREKKRLSITATTPIVASDVTSNTADVTDNDERKTNEPVVASTSPSNVVSTCASNTVSPSNTVYYSVDELRKQSVPGLDYKNREIYLHPDEFQKLFAMSIAEFNEQPKWKRTQLKRKLKLF